MIPTEIVEGIFNPYPPPECFFNEVNCPLRLAALEVLKGLPEGDTDFQEVVKSMLGIVQWPKVIRCYSSVSREDWAKACHQANRYRIDRAFRKISPRRILRGRSKVYSPVAPGAVRHYTRKPGAE